MSLFETRKELDPELENGLKEMQNMDFPNASCGSNPRNIRKTVPNKKKFHNCTLCVLSFSRKSDLKKHILTDHAGIVLVLPKIHIETVYEGKKLHKCQSCDLSFAHKSQFMKD